MNGRREADDDRHARAHHQLREHVGARLGGAERVRGRRPSSTAVLEARGSSGASSDAEHGEEREQPEHADAEQPALGPEQQPPGLAHDDCTLGSSTK